MSYYLITGVDVSTGDFTCLGMHQRLSFFQDASGENAGVRTASLEILPAMQLARLLQGHSAHPPRAAAAESSDDRWDPGSAGSVAHSSLCEYFGAGPQPLLGGTGDTSLNAAAQVLQEHAGQLGQVFIARLHLGVADELPPQPAQLGHAHGPAEDQPVGHAGDADGLSGLGAAPLRGQHGGQHVLGDAVQLVQEPAGLQRLRAGGAVRRRRGALEQRGADGAQRQRLLAAHGEQRPIPAAARVGLLEGRLVRAAPAAGAVQEAARRARLPRRAVQLVADAPQLVARVHDHHVPPAQPPLHLGPQRRPAALRLGHDVRRPLRAAQRLPQLGRPPALAAAPPPAQHQQRHRPAGHSRPGRGAIASAGHTQPGPAPAPPQAPHGRARAAPARCSAPRHRFGHRDTVLTLASRSKTPPQQLLERRDRALARRELKTEKCPASPDIMQCTELKSRV